MSIHSLRNHRKVNAPQSFFGIKRSLTNMWVGRYRYQAFMMADMKLFLGIVNEKKILGVINIGIGNKNQVSVTSVKVIWCKASVHA